MHAHLTHSQGPRGGAIEPPRYDMHPGQRRHRHADP